MIFVTVGTQLPFDRLLNAVESFAVQHPEQELRAQTGETALNLTHTHARPFFAQAEMDAAFEAAEIIVGHAGMGTILTGAALGKPVVVMPRQAALGEHRNDHQAATAARLAHLPHLHVVQTAAELNETLVSLLASGSSGTKALGTNASPELLSAVASFIQTGRLEAA